MRFDAVLESENGFLFELKNTDQITGSGVTLEILGRHADKVDKWVNKLVNANTREAQIAARQGKTVDAKSLDEIRDQNIEGALVRVVGWSGVAQPYSEGLLKAALLRNPHWVFQIINQSDNLGNFSSKQ